MEPDIENEQDMELPMPGAPEPSSKTFTVEEVIHQILDPLGRDIQLNIPLTVPQRDALMNKMREYVTALRKV